MIYIYHYPLNEIILVFSKDENKKLTEFIIPRKAIYVLKLIKPINQYFREFLLPLFNSTWDNSAEIIKQLVIIFTACLSKIRGQQSVYAAFFSKSDGIAEMN